MRGRPWRGASRCDVTADRRRGAAPASPRHWRPVISDPLFSLLAIPAVTVLGLGKGGFAGIGMAATPLLALRLPPLQAAAIMLPLGLCQDVISVGAFRRDW